MTVNVLTGELTFTNKNGEKSTVKAGSTAVVQGNAITSLMSTTDALKSGNTAFAQVTQQSLLSAVSALASIAKLLPNNTQVSSLLQTVVTQATTLATNAGNTALVSNIVGFAVANAPAAQQNSITSAAQSGVQNASVPDSQKSQLTEVVNTSAVLGDQARSSSAPITTTTTAGGVNTVRVTPQVDPSQTVISPSGRN